MQRLLTTAARALGGALLLAALLAACTKPTPYQAATADSPYGYSDTKIDDNTVRIEVAGNNQTPRELVENQLLYRAAQMAINRGDETFVFLTRDTERDVRYQPQLATLGFPYYVGPFGGGYYGPYRSFGLGIGLGFGGYGYPGYGYYGGPVREIDRYTAYAEARFFKGEPPEGEGPGYVAAEVVENLAGKINKQPAGED